MLSAEDLGVDARASELLSKSPFDVQQHILKQLSEGISTGKVRNASAYVVHAARGPTSLGLDERATEMLKQLPRRIQNELQNHLREKTDVQNPSAWMVKACLKAKQQTGPSFGGFMPMASMGGFQGGFQAAGRGKKFQLDDKAEQLLSTLPKETKTEIIRKLAQQTGVNNPSAWVVKQAMQAGARPNMGGNMMPMGHVGAGVRGGGGGRLDGRANALMSTLPEGEQLKILKKLMSDGSITNPSAWVAKAAMNAGAQPPQAGGGGMMSGSGEHLDEAALELLGGLPEEQQADIMQTLQSKQAAGEVRNASGWVVKAVINAKRGSFGGAAKGGGKMRASPF